MGLQERLDALQPRERRLLMICVGLFVAICLLGIPAAVSATLVEKRSENEGLHEAIARLFAEKDAIVAREEFNERVLARYREEAPPLAGLIDRHAKSLSLEIPEFKDRPVVPHGKKYEEHSTEIRLKKVGMRDLVLFVEKLAQERYPISITKLSIRRRGSAADEWDTTMIVSAYHLSADGREKLNAGAAAERKAEEPQTATDESESLDEELE